jgi:hypothetical protein
MDTEGIVSPATVSPAAEIEERILALAADQDAPPPQSLNLKFTTKETKTPAMKTNPEIEAIIDHVELPDGSMKFKVKWKRLYRTGR